MINQLRELELEIMDWSRVIFNGEVTYVASNYLTTEKPPEKIPVKVPIKNRNIDPLKPMDCTNF